jgi:hypothetical protein
MEKGGEGMTKEVSIMKYPRYEYGVVTDTGEPHKLPVGKRPSVSLQVGDVVLPVSHDSSTYRTFYYYPMKGNRNPEFSSYVYDPKVRVRPLTEEEWKTLRAKCAEWLPKGKLFFSTSSQTGQTGADPEVFAVDGKGRVIPAWQYLPSKDNPIGLEGASDSDDDDDDQYSPEATAFYDGFQAEFTIRPAHCHDSVNYYIRQGLQLVYKAMRRKHRNAHLTHRTVLDIPAKMMAAAADGHVALGCAPSFNIYEDFMGPQVDNPRDLPIRFAGCHIHLGIGERNREREYVTRMVRWMDILAGVASVSLLRGLEDPRRREFYGRAGEHRLPPHGLEWRVLSSAALIHPVVQQLLFDLTRMSARMVATGTERVIELSIKKPVERIINDLDVPSARRFIRRNRALYKALFDSRYYRNDAKANALRLIEDGAVNCLDCSSIETNWNLDSDKSPTMRRVADSKLKPALARASRA